MAECPGKEQQFANAIIDRQLQHDEFRHFVAPWIERSTDPEPFATLINLWVAFNSWLCEIITAPEFIDSDAALVSAAAKDAEIQRRFDGLIAKDVQFRTAAEDFRSLLPVFNVRALDRRHIGAWPEWQMSRDEYRLDCFNRGVQPREFRPKCWWDHQPKNAAGAGDPASIPLDWPHVVASIYQIRCNLFHGGKNFRTESDVRFARLAFQMLWMTWACELG